MASISIQISSGYTGISNISVKANGDATERYSAIQNGVLYFSEKPGNHTYTVVVHKVDCGVASASFSLNCTEIQSCNIIEQINF